MPSAGTRSPAWSSTLFAGKPAALAAAGPVGSDSLYAAALAPLR